jgi:nucleotide-binding universal stress UspA family protein
MMFERVLIPTDSSRFAHKMMECIAEIPGLKEVLLLNVLDASNPMNLEKSGWSYDSLISDAETRLKEQAENLSRSGKSGLIVRSILKVIVEPMSGADGVNLQRLEPRSDVGLIYGGNIGEAIRKTALEENVSLIVMGAEGKGLVEGVLLGSVSTEVLRHGETDLLLIRHQVLEGGKGKSLEKFCPNIFSRLLVTTDFSPAAKDAISLVKGLQGVFEILLVHVISKGEDLNEAAKLLNLMREELAEIGRNVTVHVLEGHPAEEILNLAKKQDVSLLIMSSQGKGWLKQIRVGSVSFDVARRSDRPVLVVRQKKQ